MTGTCCPPRLAAERASRNRKTPERGKRRLASLSCYLMAIAYVCMKRREGAHWGRPCRACAGRSSERGSAVRPPGLRVSHLVCLWLAIWSAHWLLLPGVGRVCLSVPGRGGRPEFDQTCDADLRRSAASGCHIDGAVYRGLLWGLAVYLAGQVAVPSQSRGGSEHGAGSGTFDWDLLPSPAGSRTGE